LWECREFSKSGLGIHLHYIWTGGNVENCKTTLKDINTKELHYLKGFEPNHIVIDFDIKDENGNKSKEKNLEAANKWPRTYVEFKTLKEVNEFIDTHPNYIYYLKDLIFSSKRQFSSKWRRWYLLSKLKEGEQNEKTN